MASDDQICRLCTQEVSDAIHLFSGDSVERGVANRISNVLDLPLEEKDGLSSYVCQLCNARFNQLVRTLEVQRLKARKSYDKLAKKAGIVLDELLDEPVDEGPAVEDAKNPKKDPLVEAADMTSMDLGSLLSDLVAAKQRQREKTFPTQKKIVTEDIKDLMNLLSGIRKEDVFVFGTFLGVSETRLRDIEHNYSDNLQRFLAEVVTAWINGCPEAATWTNLVEALTEVGRRKNAQEIAEKRGLILPGVYDDGQLWKALKALIPISEGDSDLVTLLDETEGLRKDVKAKDALLLKNEERLDEVNQQKMELEQQYNDTLQELENKKTMLEDQKRKTQKDLREKEAELRKLRANRADKESIESMEIEIMYLRKKVQQHQTQELDLKKKIIELQDKLESIDVGKLDWIAKNLEKECEGLRPEFEANRSQMMQNIYKMLKYIKIPEDAMDGEEEQHEGSPDPEPVVTAEVEEDEEVVEETVQETTPEPEPTDLATLLSSLKSETMFEDKPFLEEDHPLALGLFQGIPPFLLSQILGLPMDQWQAIEKSDLKDEEKQRSNVLSAWGKTGHSVTWSVLVEILIELGLRERAQNACIEKGVPLQDVSEDGPVWQAMKETLSRGSAEVQELLQEVEGIRAEVKAKDMTVCVQESELENARVDNEFIQANLRRAKKGLTKEMSQCKSLETQISEKLPSSPVIQIGLHDVQDDEFNPELEVLKQQHKQHLSAIQNLWKEKEEHEAQSLLFELQQQQQQTDDMKKELAEERQVLVSKLETMYELYTGREKLVEPKEVIEEVVEETNQETTPESEPEDLATLLSSLKSPREEASSMFEDKPFVVEKDHPLALSLFQGVPPFLLSQILGLPMDQWQVIEKSDLKDEEKQRSNVLSAWGKTGHSVTWSVLVEILIELGLRGRAQNACIEKGVPMLDVSEDGPVWQAMKKTLSRGNPEVQEILREVERIRVEMKVMDATVCIQESEMEKARMENELIKANLKGAKRDLNKEISQCQSLEMQISQKFPGSLANQADAPNENDHPMLKVLKQQHKQHLNAIQNLWKEKEDRRVEYEAHSLQFEPQQQQMDDMKKLLGEERQVLVAKLETMYELYTGREKPVEPTKRATPQRPPRPQPRLPPPPPTTPGGYRASSQIKPNIDPVLPTGYSIMDLFHPSNTFSLLPASDIVSRPVYLSGNFLTGFSLKGRGSLADECVFTADVAAPWVVALKVPNRGRIMVDDRRMISISKTAPYQVGDPAFEFIVRPCEDKRVTLESRKFANSFLSVGQNAAVSVQEMPPDCAEVQFAVRVQRFNGAYTTQIVCPFGRPSLVNQLKDRSVIQLYVKATGVYLGLKTVGGVVGITNPDSDLTHLIYCDRGLGRVSLTSVRGMFKIKMRFNGNLVCQGEENVDNDFYFKESPDGSVVFESVPNKGKFITVPCGKQLIRNFNINLLVFSGQGKQTTVTKYSLN